MKRQERIIAGGRALVLSVDHLAAGRCLREGCRVDHLEGEDPSAAIVLSCPNCRGDLTVAFVRATSCLELACERCSSIVALAPLLPLEDAWAHRAAIQVAEDALSARQNGGPQ